MCGTEHGGVQGTEDGGVQGTEDSGDVIGASTLVGGTGEISLGGP
jgi:hypothetical protein